MNCCFATRKPKILNWIIVKRIRHSWILFEFRLCLRIQQFYIPWYVFQQRCVCFRQKCLSSEASGSLGLGVFSCTLDRISPSYILERWWRPSSLLSVGFIFLIAIASLIPRRYQLSSVHRTVVLRSFRSCVSLATWAENSVFPSVRRWFDPVCIVL